MAKLLILAPTGFGKSAGIGPSTELGFIGLNPVDTYVISVTSKPLPFRGSEVMFPSVKGTNVAVKLEDLRGTSRFISNDAKRIVEVINLLNGNPRIKNVVIDDTNYIMQDYYMDNALKAGWDAPKKVGYDMGLIFKALENIVDKNTLVLGHYQVKSMPNDETKIEFQLKTTGKMVDEYLTPGGKFDICLIGKTKINSDTKKVEKYYVTNDDGETSGAKSAPGMFPLNITNDLGVIVKLVNEYYGTVPTVETTTDPVVIEVPISETIEAPSPLS